MSDQMSLEGILSDEKPAPVEVPAEPVAAPKDPAEIPAQAKDPVEAQQAKRNEGARKKWRDTEQAAQGRVRDPETGQYAPKEEAPAEPVKEAVKESPKETATASKPDTTAAPQQEFTEKEKAFLRAAQEERGKRQALEQRIAQMEASKPKEPEKQFWDDPEGAIAKQRQEFQKQLVSMRLGTSEQIARSRYPDFDEKVAKFSEMAMTIPGLGQQMLQHPDPATFAYTTAKNNMELQQAGGMEEMRAKIERETTARVRAEVEAELKAKAEALEKARADLPGSLSQARSTGPANRPVWSGPESLDTILKG